MFILVLVQLASSDHDELQQDKNGTHHLQHIQHVVQRSCLPNSHLTEVELTDIIQFVTEQELEHK